MPQSPPAKRVAPAAAETGDEGIGPYKAHP